MGLSAAVACAREGARLVVCGRDDEWADAATAALGDEVPCVRGDATDPALAARVVADAVARHGRVDGVFHVAGGSGRRFGDGALHDVTDDGWQQTLALNLTTTFNTTRAAVQYFLSAGHGGSIVTMTSVLAYAPSPRHFATHAYAAAKAGIIGLTRSSAAYYAPHDIRVNAIAPALVDTPMARRAVGDRSIDEYIRHKQPLDGGRVVRADDVDGAVVYLLSRESRMVTGQVLAVDGGWCVSA